MNDFERHLRLVEPQIHHAETVVVSFASGPVKFEFGSFLRECGIPHVLFRDSSEKWYQEGILGIGDRTSTVLFVNELKRSYDRVVTLGLSAGAYGALMYGQLAKVDKVVAISPITAKGNYLFPEFDCVWHERVALGPEHPVVEDLHPLFIVSSVLVEAFVSDGDGTELDRQMCERIGIGNIKFIPGYSHPGLAAFMRDSGMLEQVLRGQ
jgi:hypothetical protein